MLPTSIELTAVNDVESRAVRTVVRFGKYHNKHSLRTPLWKLGGRGTIPRDWLYLPQIK